MATICSICNKRISAFANDYPIIKGNTEFRICSGCKALTEIISWRKKDDEFEEA